MIRTSLVLLVLLGAGNVVRAQDDEAAEARRYGKATIEAARQGLEKELTFFRVRELFWWSQRILYAELELCAKPADRLTAFQDHVRRCKDFENRIGEMRKKGQIPIQDVMDARFFRSRAEYWLADEKLKQKRKTAGKDRKLPTVAPPVDN